MFTEGVGTATFSCEEALSHRAFRRQVWNIIYGGSSCKTGQVDFPLSSHKFVVQFFFNLRRMSIEVSVLCSESH